MYLFDFDGTLVDSNGVWVEIDNGFLARRGLTPTREYSDTVGHSIFPIAAQFTKDYYCLDMTPEAMLATCFYGISMTVMMFMSGVYHAMPTGSTAKRVLRRFDYTSIYLLIGGTFAPILLVYKGGRVGITIFCIQWGVILFGVTMVAIFGPGRWRALHFTLYFLIGWSGLMFIPDFYANARPLLWLILAGGLVYTLGMIPFVRSRKYDHCIWHVFVLAAAALHWVGIYTQIYT